MILEMDQTQLEVLLADSEALQSAIGKAKANYMSKRHPSALPLKEDVGEKLYETIVSLYPQHASKITGTCLLFWLWRIQQTSLVIARRSS